jgi:anti-sigma B factor antagonist
MKSKDLFNSYEKNGVIVIELPSRLDASISNDLKEIISSHVSNNKYKFLIDFSKTAFIDSSGLGAIVSKISICRTNNGDVSLCNVNNKIKEVLNITHLDKILKIYKTLDEGINSLSNNG